VQELVSLSFERLHLGVFPGSVPQPAVGIKEMQAQFTGRLEVEARHPDVAAGLLVGFLGVGGDVVELAAALAVERGRNRRAALPCVSLAVRNVSRKRSQCRNSS